MKWFLFLAIGTVLAIVCTLEEQEEDRELQRYCEMVTLHNQDVTLGWPDFKGIYEEQCK
jgi:hypothetical protein